MGKFYTDKINTIYHGDALSVLASSDIPNESVDLIFADPPYNIGKNFNGFIDKWRSDEDYINWIEKWLSLCFDKLKPNGSLYLMCSTQCSAYIDILLRKYLTVMSRIIWHYDSSGVQAKKYYGSLWEPIFHCVKNKNRYTFNSANILVEAKTGAKRKLIDYRKSVPTTYNTKKVPGNAWYFPRVRYRMVEYEKHPTQKPLDLLKRIVLASSNENDVILDPFAGTFTTGYAAKILNRRSISIEINEEYLKIGLRRLGILTHYKGKKLKAIDKNYKLSTKENQQNLF